MQESLPGFVVTAKVRWTNSPEPVGTHLFFFSPTVIHHALPCIIEELGESTTDKNGKTEQVVKVRVLVRQTLHAKAEFKLQFPPADIRAEGIVQEVA